MTEIKELLSSVRVSDIISGQELLKVYGGDTLGDAVSLLMKSDISSVPVFKGPEDTKLDNCLGIIDFTDISNTLLDLMKKGYTQHDPRKNIWKKFNSLKVSEAIKFNAAKFVQTKATDPILEVVEYTAEFGFRRMLAIDVDNTIVGVVSPSELCKKILDTLGEKESKLMDSSLSELNVGSLDVISVKKNQTVSSALKILDEKFLTALAVVDTKSGELNANFSVSDVALVLQKESVGMLNYTVWKFVTEKKNKEVDARYPYFSVKETTSLKKTIQRILATKVHHLYIIDEKNIPLKVVGFSDICRGLLSYKFMK